MAFITLNTPLARTCVRQRVVGNSCIGYKNGVRRSAADCSPQVGLSPRMRYLSVNRHLGQLNSKS
jgi:hypothetical protein